MSDAERPVVVVLDEQADLALDLDRWRTLAEDSLVSSGAGPGELNLLFVDEQAMAELNETHMGARGPTDVLSFPLDGAPAGEAAPADVGEALIGDIVVCPSYAARQAAARAESLDDELALLVVHGVLHILGHDHAEPEETRIMRACEQELLAAHHRA